MARASRLAPRLAWGEIRLVLTDNAGISRLHSRWMGAPLVTDVLSQRYDAVPGQPAVSDGEIVINVQRALEWGPACWLRRFPKADDASAQELALYMAHGCDHLAGSDDGTPAERRAMRQRELRWLMAARAAGLFKGLTF
ncbi:MAG: rRNA maturation RNase YbeY [Lentisphaerae bacterium]|nr:rRNA maturation RNase YbeY [Lentisphaerota bacterium]